MRQRRMIQPHAEAQKQIVKEPRTNLSVCDGFEECSKQSLDGEAI